MDSTLWSRDTDTDKKKDSGQVPGCALQSS